MDNEKSFKSECNELSELISAYFDNELSEKEALRVKKHIESSRECFELFENIRTLSNDITESAEIPDNLHQTIMSAVMREKNKEKTKKRLNNSHIRRLGLWCGAAACAVLCITMLAKPLLQNNNTDALFDVEMSEKGFAALKTVDYDDGEVQDAACEDYENYSENASNDSFYFDKKEEECEDKGKASDKNDIEISSIYLGNDFDNGILSSALNGISEAPSLSQFPEMYVPSLPHDTFSLRGTLHRRGELY